MECRKVLRKKKTNGEESTPEKEVIRHIPDSVKGIRQTLKRSQSVKFGRMDGEESKEQRGKKDNRPELYFA